MKNWLWLLGVILTAGLPASAQRAHSDFCPMKSLSDDLIVSVCTNERGMAPPIQPRLYVGVHANGVAEYETENSGGLVTRRFQLTAADMTLLKEALAMPEMSTVRPDYPVYRPFDDSSLETSLLMRVADSIKSVLLRNFVTNDCGLDKVYPRPLVMLMRSLARYIERGTGTVKEIQQLSFDGMIASTEDCSLDWSDIDIYADYEHRSNVLASGQIVNERAILYDHEGTSKKEIEMEFGGTAAAIQKAKDVLSKVETERFGGRGRILARGRYDRKRRVFLLSQVTGIEPIDIPFDGEIKLGVNYVDTFDPRRGPEEEQLTARLKHPMHHAGRVELLNAGRSPRLTGRGLRLVVFRANSVTTSQISTGRWNDIYNCTILDFQ
jgi:hypothetical protein